MSDYVMVPREPTAQMLKAAFVGMNATPGRTWKSMKEANLSPREIFEAKMRPRWADMLAAASALSAALAQAPGRDAIEPIWKAGDSDGGFGDTMEIIHPDDLFLVEIDEPWAGDTETGFGQTGRISLSKADAVALHGWLGARLALLEPRP